MSNASSSGQTPAGWYGNPQQPTQERWWDGHNWTEHYRTKPVPAPVVRAQESASLSSLACPACGSQDVRTLKIIHSQGTTTGTASTTGWIQGAGSQPGHLATFSTSTKTLTDAARKAAPPKKKFNGVTLFVIGVVVGGIGAWLYVAGGVATFAGTFATGIVAAIVIGIVLVLAGVIVAVRDSNYNRDVFPSAYAKWDRSWQCQRCGTVSTL